MTSTEEKSEDKKQIEEEEREKMLNEENARESQPPAAGDAPADGSASPLKGDAPAADASATDDDKKEGAPRGEVEKMKKALEESEKDAGKKKIPIGGIRIPGFLRSRSREKNNKDGESEQEEENKDLLPDSQGQNGSQDKDSMHDGQTPPPRRLPALKFIPNPFKKNKESAPVPTEAAEGGDGGGDGGGGNGAPHRSKRDRLLEAIQLPLVSILPRRNRAPKDVEIGQAGLASMETLDDKSAADTAEDGMESVKLDVDEKDGEKNIDAAAGKDVWQERIRFVMKYRLIIGLVALFVIIVIAIFVIAFSGSRMPVPLRRNTGKFVTALTSCGRVEGVREEGGYAFRGIPYAAPPVGEQRWRPARLAESLGDCWNDTLIAHNATPSCLQLQPDNTWEGVEDCLTLDVFTPYVGYDKPVPVVVMIGAESMLGGSPGRLLPAAKLAHDRELVLVRPNFRMGVLGFLAHDSLTMTQYLPTSGNYGLSDILAALRWVQLNVEHFGGDKKQVTLLGHRAGATLVAALMSSRLARDLFHRVWLSSAAATFPGKPLSESSARNARFVNSVAACRDKTYDNVELAGCLRSLDATSLLAALPDAWRPLPLALPSPDAASSAAHEWLVLDGVILQRHPFEVFDNETLPFSIVIGTTQHVEATPELHKKYEEWAAGGGEEAAKQHISRWISSLQQDGANRSLAEEAMRAYGGASWPAFASMVSDIRTLCPLLDMSNRMKQSSPVFYIATEGRGSPAVADASLDADAISSRFVTDSVQERRHITAMQHVFYPFAYSGTVRRDESKGGELLLIGQDANPSLKYPNCDLWLANDIVPRFARVD